MRNCGVLESNCAVVVENVNARKTKVLHLLPADPLPELCPWSDLAGLPGPLYCAVPQNSFFKALMHRRHIIPFN